jgi:hypothetical protein
VAGVAVCLVRDLPDRLAGAAEVEVLQCRGDQAGSARDGLLEGGCAGCARCRGWDVAAEVAVDQGDDPVDQVAEAVGEFLVGAGGEAARGVVGVRARRHLTQQPPAHRVDAVPGGQVVGVDGGAAGLADLAAVLGEVAVHGDVRGQDLAGGQQDGGPVDGVEPQHALAEQVDAL